MRCHSTSTRIAIFKKPKTKISVNKELKELEPYTLLVRIWNSRDTMENSLAFLKKFNIDPTIPFRGRYPRELKTDIQTKIWIRIFITLFIRWKQPNGHK